MKKSWSIFIVIVAVCVIAVAVALSQIPSLTRDGAQQSRTPAATSPAVKSPTAVSSTNPSAKPSSNPSGFTQSPTSPLTSPTGSAVPPPATAKSIKIAAADASEREKVEADVICAGKDDSGQIAAIVNALPPGSVVRFSQTGTFNLEKRLYVRNVRDLTFNGGHFRVADAIKSATLAASQSGQAQLTLTSTRGFIVGQDIYIGSTPGSGHVSVTASPPNWEPQRQIGPQGESNIVTAVSDTTLTLFYSLTNSYGAGVPLWTIYDALYFDSCDNLKISGVSLDGNIANQTPCTGDIFQNGIRISVSKNVEVFDNSVTNVLYNFIMLHPGASPNARIHDNTTFASQTPPGTTQNRGITVEGRSDGTVVFNNSATGHQIGLYDVGTSVDFAWNNISNTVYYGIETNGILKSTIRNNIILNPVSNAGISILANPASDVSISGNQIINPKTDYGIFGVVPSQNLTIKGNRIEGPQKIFSLSATNSTIDGNVLGSGPSPNYRDNLVVSGSGNTWNNNYSFGEVASGEIILGGGMQSIVVKHGLNSTPVLVLLNAQRWGEASDASVSNITDRQFTISLNRDPGAPGAAISWKAFLGDGIPPP
jgi:hypothetical protein